MTENTVQSAKNLKILFVCIGNSCRSPMAESILKHMIKSNSELQWEIDSAALRSWNVGYSPEERCIEVLKENGMTSDHIGRQINLSDFYKFDYIFGMDNSNIRELENLAPSDCNAKIKLLGEYMERKDKIIQDPYFDHGIHSFRRSYDEITESCKNFVAKQLNRIN